MNPPESTHQQQEPDTQPTTTTTTTRKSKRRTLSTRKRSPPRPGPSLPSRSSSSTSFKLAPSAESGAGHDDDDAETLRTLPRQRCSVGDSPLTPTTVAGEEGGMGGGEFSSIDNNNNNKSNNDNNNNVGEEEGKGGRLDGGGSMVGLGTPDSEESPCFFQDALVPVGSSSSSCSAPIQSDDRRHQKGSGGGVDPLLDQERDDPLVRTDWTEVVIPVKGLKIAGYLEPPTSSSDSSSKFAAADCTTFDPAERRRQDREACKERQTNLVSNIVSLFESERQTLRKTGIYADTATHHSLTQLSLLTAREKIKDARMEQVELQQQAAEMGEMRARVEELEGVLQRLKGEAVKGSGMYSLVLTEKGGFEFEDTEGLGRYEEFVVKQGCVATDGERRKVVVEKRKRGDEEEDGDGEQDKDEDKEGPTVKARREWQEFESREQTFREFLGRIRLIPRSEDDKEAKGKGEDDLAEGLTPQPSSKPAPPQPQPRLPPPGPPTDSDDDDEESKGKGNGRKFATPTTTPATTQPRRTPTFRPPPPTTPPPPPSPPVNVPPSSSAPAPIPTPTPTPRPSPPPPPPQPPQPQTSQPPPPSESPIIIVPPVTPTNPFPNGGSIEISPLPPQAPPQAPPPSQIPPPPSQTPPPPTQQTEPTPTNTSPQQTEPTPTNTSPPPPPAKKTNVPPAATENQKKPAPPQQSPTWDQAQQGSVGSPTPPSAAAAAPGSSNTAVMVLSGLGAGAVFVLIVAGYVSSQRQRRDREALFLQAEADSGDRDVEKQQQQQPKKGFFLLRRLESFKNGVGAAVRNEEGKVIEAPVIPKEEVENDILNRKLMSPRALPPRPSPAPATPATTTTQHANHPSRPSPTPSLAIRSTDGIFPTDLPPTPTSPTTARNSLITSPPTLLSRTQTTVSTKLLMREISMTESKLTAEQSRKRIQAIEDKLKIPVDSIKMPDSLKSMIMGDFLTHLRSSTKLPDIIPSIDAVLLLSTVAPDLWKTCVITHEKFGRFPQTFLYAKGYVESEMSFAQRREMRQVSTGARVYKNPVSLRKSLATSYQRFLRQRFVSRIVVKDCWREILEPLRFSDTPVDFANAFRSVVDVDEVRTWNSPKTHDAELAKVMTSQPEFEDLLALQPDIQARKIVSFYSRFIRNIRHSPDHPLYKSPTKLTKLLISKESNRLTKTSQERKKELKGLLEKYHLELRDDSTLANAYINGQTDKDVEHVVAILMITSELFEYGHVVWSQLSGECEAELERQAWKGPWDREGKPDWIMVARGVVDPGECERVKEEWVESSLRQMQSRHYRGQYDDDDELMDIYEERYGGAYDYW
ncbi:hypothetical protein HDV05_004201 [Chytridiales sp. JEL 0842]|nr:hypothetical protein HDV05_004201 [Chytridiales sp. JEL 0842]